jgi:osmoprotectant transport system permease protein
MIEQLALLPGLLTAHLQLTLAALVVSTVVSVPLGLVAARVAWLEQPILGVAGVIQTVPSLALLAIMVPLLAALSLPSIGLLPAFIGLTLYGVLPVLRNTVTGIAGVDPALREAARGVGMTDMQMLRRVELPLAMPVIVAGLRTSTVWVVGMATLSTPVGASSLGNYIFSGLQTRNLMAVLVGCVAAAGLALVLDGLVHAVEAAIRGRRRGRLAVSLGLTGLLIAYAGATLVRDLRGGDGPTVVVGSKAFTEQYILSHLIADVVERDTGLDTRLVQSLGSTVAFDALEAGTIDVYVDYTGTIWATIMRRTSRVERRADVVGEVRQYLRDTFGIVLVAPLGFENAYALAMRRVDAERLGLRTISDMAPHAKRLTVGADYEFFARPEWPAVRNAYDLVFESRRTMDPALMYQAAAEGSVDVITAFTTDGRVAALDLRILVDDRGAIPPYDAVVLASRSLAVRHPEVLSALAGLQDTIDADTMRRMNLAVDARGESPAGVARRFLDEGP